MNPNEVPLAAIAAAEDSYQHERWASHRVRLKYAIATAFGAMPTYPQLQAQIDALNAERDGIFNLLRKCAHAMDAGRIDVDLIEEVRATLPDTKEKP